MKKALLFFGGHRQEQDWDHAGMDSSLADNGIYTYRADTEDILGSKRLQWLRRHVLRTLIYVAWERRGSVTLKTKLARRLARRYRLETAMCRAVDRIVDGEYLARWLNGKMPVAPAALELTTTIKPSLVIAATDVYRSQEAELFVAAKIHCIPTLGLVGSWDTLTSKGSYLVKPDHLAVWGEASADHAIRLHGFDKDRVHVIGSLRLDYPETREIPDILGPDQPPVVMVVGTSVAYWDQEAEMVRRLAALGISKGFKIWYRPHPRRLGRMEGDLSPLRARWAHLGVHFDSGAGDSKDPEPPGILRAILRRVRVVVTAFSTVVIEAALQGTPSLLVGFGPSTGGFDNTGESGGKLLDHAEMEHMMEVVSWPGIRVCKSQGDLDAHILHYVAKEDSRLVVESRRERALTVAKTDGQVAHRLTNLIVKLSESV